MKRNIARSGGTKHKVLIYIVLWTLCVQKIVYAKVIGCVIRQDIRELLCNFHSFIHSFLCYRDSTWHLQHVSFFGIPFLGKASPSFGLLPISVARIAFITFSPRAWMRLHDVVHNIIYVSSLSPVATRSILVPWNLFSWFPSENKWMKSKIHRKINPLFGSALTRDFSRNRTFYFWVSYTIPIIDIELFVASKKENTNIICIEIEEES